MSTNQLLFEGATLPFNVKNTINWRGIEFHLMIEGKATRTGADFTVTILYADKRFVHRTVQSKQWWHKQGAFPEIENETHILRFALGKVPFKSFSLTEELKSNEADAITAVSPFKISGVPPTVHFTDPVEIEIVKKIPEQKINKLEVVLYEFKSMELNINSFAYFENENLIIDYWKMGGNYEDECFITIEKDALIQLYDFFQIKNEIRKEQLLQSILNMFHGKDCFNKIEGFLNAKSIEYSVGFRR